MAVAENLAETADAEPVEYATTIDAVRQRLQQHAGLFMRNQRGVRALVDRLYRENLELSDGIRAAFNILEDFEEEKQALAETQRATTNILEDFEQEKRGLATAETAAFNILEDFDEEKSALAEAQRATLNLLDDFEQEKQTLGAGMTAAFNILEDLHSENAWLQQSQSAMLNLLEDLDAERAYAAAAGAALARANAQRAETAEQHARESEQFNEALVAANKELEAFSYSVSHDLRAPLRAIDGFSRILLDDYADQLDGEGRRVLNVVRDSTLKMAQLIDDILAFSRAGRIEMASEAVDIDSLVRGILAGPLASALAGRALTIEIAALPTASGDRAMLERVWTNLLENAIKFTAPKPGGRIEIGAAAGDRETIYHVRDNGVGFDMRYADKLFGVFQRLHGSDIPGTGIGLAIVKRLVDRQGGRVWGEGAVGEGATFYFTMPAELSND